ncbi:hypothetical protein G8759_15715 [Spirosoma aureum]|uniref:Uncharacterized protein n=1 Tax=Spirosoma aureum TaxID=2692134 RepID=A0A6G9ANU6_9BACT|nr:hypothetical protein [Spirosoma aureum]QIP13955.1 hypothetical protein G8759_15715 [Spirosoma aureum]
MKVFTRVSAASMPIRDPKELPEQSDSGLFFQRYTTTQQPFLEGLFVRRYRNNQNTKINLPAHQ